MRGEEITREWLEGMKKALTEASRAGVGTFIYNGRVYLQSYARYVIEWAESELAKH